jgi:predicted amidophosphoribosyltransferase
MNNKGVVTVTAQIVGHDRGSEVRCFSVSHPRRCRQCGTDVSRSMKRCPTCGQPLSANRHVT